MVKEKVKGKSDLPGSVSKAWFARGVATCGHGLSSWLAGMIASLKSDDKRQGKGPRGAVL